MQNEEKVACIPKSVLQTEQYLTRLHTGNLVVFTPENAYERILTYVEYHPRIFVEHDPDVLQLIPYVVCYTHNIYRDVPLVFMYQRSTTGDDRLQKLWSIGLGGHVRMNESIQDAITRELKEEIGIEPTEHLKMIGYLYAPYTEVSMVHLGIIFSMYVPPDTVFDVLYQIEKRKELYPQTYEIEKLELWNAQTLRYLILRASSYKLEDWSHTLILHPEFLHLFSPVWE